MKFRLFFLLCTLVMSRLITTQEKIYLVPIALRKLDNTKEYEYHILFQVDNEKKLNALQRTTELSENPLTTAEESLKKNQILLGSQQNKNVYLGGSIILKDHPFTYRTRFGSIFFIYFRFLNYREQKNVDFFNTSRQWVYHPLYGKYLPSDHTLLSELQADKEIKRQLEHLKPQLLEQDKQTQQMKKEQVREEYKKERTQHFVDQDYTFCLIPIRNVNGILQILAKPAETKKANLEGDIEGFCRYVDKNTPENDVIHTITNDNNLQTISSSFQNLPHLKGYSFDLELGKMTILFKPITEDIDYLLDNSQHQWYTVTPGILKANDSDFVKLIKKTIGGVETNIPLITVEIKEEPVEKVSKKSEISTAPKKSIPKKRPSVFAPIQKILFALFIHLPIELVKFVINPIRFVLNAIFKPKPQEGRDNR